jgi:hypothetical protein
VQLPLSQADLPAVIEAVRDLIRAIEFPQDQERLINQIHATRRDGDRPKLVDSAIIRQGGDVLAALLTFSFRGDGKWELRDRIVGCHLGTRQRAALRRILELIRAPLFGWWAEKNRDEAVDRLVQDLETLTPRLDPAIEPASRRASRKAGSPPRYDSNRDAKLVADWQIAKSHGMNKKSFCRKSGVKTAELNKALDRVRHRRRKNSE